MLSIDRQIYKRFKEGEIGTEDLADYLLRTFPAREIALALAEVTSVEIDFKPITITQEQFNMHFRIKGTRLLDGDIVEENRGRPRMETIKESIK